MCGTTMVTSACLYSAINAMLFSFFHHCSFIFVFTVFIFSYMFWTDWGDVPKIEKCGMNGDPSSRQVLISKNILWPNALTIDYTIDRIWWADAKLHTIESTDLDGRDRRIILSENINHPFALTLFQNYMYWTDWEHHRGSINKANKFTGEERSVLQESLTSPMDIHVYHQQRQPAGRSPFIVL